MALGFFANGSAPPRQITKADLLKSLPAPRWGGAAPNKNALTHTRSRSRAGSDGIYGDDLSVRSGGALSMTGYGATNPSSAGHPLLMTVGDVGMGQRVPSSHHLRTRSDVSNASVTSNLVKSALFKGITAEGRIQLQLPKDSFRLLIAQDNGLDVGHVYKRKLVEDEGELFQEFHTVEGNLSDMEEQKHLPADLYVMAVDKTIYRRMLDEVIRSKSMPCGTFFCGHHEDVRHPSISIAALIVGLVIFLLLAGTYFL